MRGEGEGWTPLKLMYVEARGGWFINITPTVATPATSQGSIVMFAQRMLRCASGACEVRLEGMRSGVQGSSGLSQTCPYGMISTWT